MMKKGKKMATEWKKPIEKVKPLFSEKELLTMSFKEYWSIGIKEARPHMHIGSEGHMHSPAHKWWMKELKRLAPQTLTKLGHEYVESKLQKDQDFQSDMYAQDTMKIELPEKYKHYPSHLADMEA